MNAQLVDVQFLTMTPDAKILWPQEAPDRPVVAILMQPDPIEPPGPQESDWATEEPTWEDVEWQ